MTSQIDPAVETVKSLQFTPLELMGYFSRNESLELSKEQKLILYNMDVSDFLDAVKAIEASQKFGVFERMFKRFSLDVVFNGSVTLGEFGINDHSWSIYPGESGSLKISVRPSLLRRSIHEIVAFLNLLPAGQAFALKPGQDLFLEGLSPDELVEYYQFCLEHNDPQEREQGQDALFVKRCSLLSSKKMLLKIVALNAKQVDRGIDMQNGGILYKAVSDGLGKEPILALGLVEQQRT